MRRSMPTRLACKSHLVVWFVPFDALWLIPWVLAVVGGGFGERMPVVVVLFAIAKRWTGGEEARAMLSEELWLLPDQTGCARRWDAKRRCRGGRREDKGARRQARRQTERLNGAHRGQRVGGDAGAKRRRRREEKLWGWKLGECEDEKYEPNFWSWPLRPSGVIAGQGLPAHASRHPKSGCLTSSSRHPPPFPTSSAAHRGFFPFASSKSSFLPACQTLPRS
jgi:hypothetical protein